MKWLAAIVLVVFLFRYLYHKIPLMVYLRKANAGDAEAQFQMSLRYLFGYGVERSDSKSIFWMQKAAELGHPKAQCELGITYARGYQIDKDL